MISTVYQWIVNIEEKYSDQIAVQYVENGEVIKITYNRFTQDIRKAAAYFKDTYPYIEGKHIAILSRNSYSYMVCFIGIIMAGGVAVTLNPGECWDKLQDIIEFAEVSAIYSDGKYTEWDRLEEKYGSMLFEMNMYEDHEAIENWIDHTDTNNPALLMFTSGTTGRGKGILLSQKNLLTSRNQGAAVYDMEPGIPTKTYLLLLPLYHVAGITVTFGFMGFGCTINICNDLKYIYRDIKMMESERTSVVPTILKMWYKDIKAGRVERLNGIRLINCTGAASNAEIFQCFKQHGIKVYKAYGMTETCGDGTVNPGILSGKDDSVGVATPTCKVKIIDGEICLKSDGVMIGYYKQPDETAKIIQDGWVHTGDLGYLDEEGYLYLNGRKNNLIILSSGENINPEELESILYHNQFVEETVVAAKEDKLCAYIYCKKEVQEQIREYITECNKNLAMYKRITEIVFTDKPLPKTATGKIMRNMTER